MPPIEDKSAPNADEGGKPQTIGIIYPPPEVRNIVDKTASFVARNGPEFETRIRQNEVNNPKFNFLNPNDPYHAYYQHKVKDFKEGKGQEPAAPKVIGSLGIQRQQPEPIKTQEPIVPKEPPPEFEFIADPPSISAFDLDVVKLTAQFVARNGRQFLTNLINREKNYQFDFLRPQHSLFTYFTKLVEQYTKVLIPPKDLLPKLRKESQLNKEVLDQVKYRVEWAKFQERERRKEEEALERERVAYAQVDWHDFVVVETVDFQPGEIGNFPPPTTPDEVGARLLASERYDSTNVDDQAMEMDVDSDEERERTDNNQVQDMDEGSDDEMEDARPRPPTPPPPPPSDRPMAPPLPPQPDQVIIRKDYNPKASKIIPQAPAPDQYLISPITGEKIPADKIEEHMRIGLLDPKWVEEQSKTTVQGPGQEEVYAPGSSIGSSLKQLAERRTDIFGSGAEEAQIGKKIGEEDKRTKEKVIWDGHTASMERVTQKARENISIEEQIAVIHKNKGLVPDEEKEKIGPAMPNPGVPMSSMTHSSLPPSMPINAPKTLTMTQVTSMPPPPGRVLPMQPQGVMMMAPRPPPMQIRPPVVGIPGPPMPPMPPMQMQRQGGYMQQAMPPRPPPQKPVPEPPGGGDEPLTKKAKTEESLMPEEEFLKRNKAPVSFKVVVPNMPEKADWKLNGQTLTYILPLTDTVAVLKAKIHEDLSMPAGKQKLQYEGLFIKDSNSLAYYNFFKNGVVSLQLKERGGRKK